MKVRRLARSTVRRRLGLPVAVVGAVLIAEGAVWLLRPAGVIEPAEVSESAYFTPAQLERARDFRRGQRLLGLAGTAVAGTVLVLMVARPPRRAVARAERATRGRRLAAGALVGAGVVLAVRVAPLPLDAIAHERAVDVGLSTQSWGAWEWDVAKATAITALLAALAAATFLALMRRFPRRWWLGGAFAVVAIELLFVWLAPIVVAPLFNRYEKLPPGRVRSEVTELAQRTGVDVGEVFVVDASRRTTAANAFVTGIGHTKRVVLYDTLLERFSPAEVRLVVAHELAHVKQRDLWRGMLWVALVAPAALYVVMLLTKRWSKRAGAKPGEPASLPSFALALALVAFCASVVSNQLSRRIEAKADSNAIELTGEAKGFTAMERRLTLSNVADPDPPKPLVLLFATHPPPIDRIGAAVAHERGQR